MYYNLFLSMLVYKDKLQRNVNSTQSYKKDEFLFIFVDSEF